MRGTRLNHPILNKWLAGTTCYTNWVGRSVLFENEEHIVLKHNSHASYCGRATGSSTCTAYAKLYRKVDLLTDKTGYNRNLLSGDGGILQWEGRISKPKILSDCIWTVIRGPVFGVVPSTSEC